MTSPVIPGSVVWSGDNPGIYLQNDNGEWQSLAVYFRVVTSPHGSGSGMVVLGAPRTASGWPASTLKRVTKFISSRKIKTSFAEHGGKFCKIHVAPQLLII